MVKNESLQDNKEDEQIKNMRFILILEESPLSKTVVFL